MNKTLTIALLATLAVSASIIAIYSFDAPLDEAPSLRIPSFEMPSCISEGRLVPSVANAPPCCPGLIESLLVFPDEYGGCPHLPFQQGEYFCTSCGDGVCGLRETVCNCPEDCISPAREIKDMFLLDSEYDIRDNESLSDFETRIKSAFSANFPSKHSAWLSSGEGLLDWLYGNDPALMRDLIASLANPAGMRPYLSVGGPDADIIRVDEAYALSLLESVLGSEPENASLRDSGPFWIACGSGFCCEIPKLYGPGSEFSCSNDSISHRFL
jgi:hypothetical protein